MASSVSKLIHLRRVGAEQCGELNDKTVAITRTAKVVKGGRRFGFSALVVTGDGRGNVGFGLGKAAEVPDALREAGDSAKKNLIRIPIKGSTVPHDVIGEFGPTKVVIKPATPGTGVIAGHAVRAVLEGAGIKDVRTKIIGSSNPYNVLEATLTGLLRLRSPNNVASARGLDPDEIGYVGQ
jgi:small subunit ribosomal protein S5